MGVLKNEEYLGTTEARTMFVIECLNGKDIGHYKFIEDKLEILLSSGRQFEVVSCFDQGNDLYTMHKKDFTAPETRRTTCLIRFLYRSHY